MEEDMYEIDTRKLPGYKKNIPEGYKKVIYVCWEEWEPAFWVRPEGCTLHLTVEDAKKYIEKFADIWIHPAGDPVPVYVSPDLYEKVKEDTLRIGGFFTPRHKEADLVREGKLIYTEKRSGWVFMHLDGMEDS